ncbi:hypothetical protein SAMN02745150_01363 [Brevinema andersonii]|uniref:Uncharacterized protein n=1 Tax=Brevinema andersonii TaxID=34097 RepID=A0A1I1F2F0_BREAD|nr:hypothetical protein [Brevinema andersonii]SFB93112.1 hypothetical protein SAMN02745150_01363 [Brevinema andersonii]
MENYQPPAMQEVEKKQKKNKIIGITSAIIILLLIVIGSFWLVRHMKNQKIFNSLETRHKILSQYYSAVFNGNTNLIEELTDVDFTNTMDIVIPVNSNAYSLFVYNTNIVDQDTNKFLFQFIDYSISPATSYLGLVAFENDKKQKKVLLKEIQHIIDGQQIH